MSELQVGKSYRRVNFNSVTATGGAPWIHCIGRATDAANRLLAIAARAESLASIR